MRLTKTITHLWVSLLLLQIWQGTNSLQHNKESQFACWFIHKASLLFDAVNGSTINTEMFPAELQHFNSLPAVQGDLKTPTGCMKITSQEG